MILTNFDNTVQGTGTLLLSGGLDSSLLLWRLRPEKAMHINYGQKAHQMERRAALQACEATHTRFMDFLAHMAGQFEDGWAGTTIGANQKGVVRHRNLLMIAAAAAVTPKGTPVIIGCTADDEEEFPDCRAYWLERAALALEAFDTPLWAPLLEMSRAEVVEMSHAWVQGETWSCYGAGPEPCGRCLSCQQ